jgi:hypothetical protein
MFWNEPNLYGYTYREVPHIPTPFFGQDPAAARSLRDDPLDHPAVPPSPVLRDELPADAAVPPVTPFYGMNFPQTLPVPQVPVLRDELPADAAHSSGHPVLRMNFPQNLAHLPQQAPFLPQIPQINPRGLPRPALSPLLILG